MEMGVVFTREMSRQAEDHEIMHRWLRMLMVERAQVHGVAATAKALHVSPTTVRKWVRRYNDLSFMRRYQDGPIREYGPPANKTPVEIEERIVKLRKKTGYGPDRLLREFDIPVSRGTVARIIRRNSLLGQGRVPDWRLQEDEYEEDEYGDE